MSIKEEPQLETLNSNGSVPTTIKPFDGVDHGYTAEENLNSIIAAMIFSNGMEPVNKPGHHQQWKLKRAALISLTLQGPAQKCFPTYQVKPNWIGNYSAKNSRICLIPKNLNNKLKYCSNKFKNIQMNHYDH